jgi:hypothetical protein
MDKGERNIMPPRQEMSEKKFTKKVHDRLDKLGFRKSTARGKIQGLRHKFAHERYEKITGFKPRVKFETFKEYERQALSVSKDWRKIDRYARTILEMELGHGPDRSPDISRYIGSPVR